MLFIIEGRPHAPSKVELYAAIRRDARAGMSGRAIERKYWIGRRAIVKALASAWPEPRKQLPTPRRWQAHDLDRLRGMLDAGHDIEDGNGAGGRFSAAPSAHGQQARRYR